MSGVIIDLSDSSNESTEEEFIARSSSGESSKSVQSESEMEFSSESDTDSDRETTVKINKPSRKRKKPTRFVPDRIIKNKECRLDTCSEPTYNGRVYCYEHQKTHQCIIRGCSRSPMYGGFCESHNVQAGISNFNCTKCKKVKAIKTKRLCIHCICTVGVDYAREVKESGHAENVYFDVDL